MKKNDLFLMVLMLIGIAMGFSSCSSDEEGIGFADLPTPPYEHVSGKYVVNSTSSNYESIELTASGNYIITLKNSSYNTQAADMSATGKMRIFPQPKPQTRSNQYGLFIYGTYTQASENTFELEGFGKLQLNYSGDQVVNITINISGSTVTVQVTKEPTMADNEPTNTLCRTWNLEKYIYEETNKTTGETDSGTLTPENPGVEGEDMIKTIIFTKSGTYGVIYLDNSIEVARWRWKNTQAGIMEYTWEDEWADGGYCHLTFHGNRLEVYEEGEDEYERFKGWYYLKAIETEAPGKPETETPSKESPLKKVFTGKLLKELDGAKLSYENGFLKEIKDNEFNMTFTYNYVTQTPGPDVYAIIKQPSSTIEYEITLNEQGFASTIKETYTDRYDSETTRKYLKYDNEGHLIALDDHSNGRNHTIEWFKECLFRTTWGSGNWAEMTLSNQPNTNCLMFYYEVNGIDMDEAQYLYWAGLLGTSSKNLPEMKVEEDSDGYHEETTFTWTDHSLTYTYGGSRGTINFSFYD